MPLLCPICGNIHGIGPCPYCIKIREEKKQDVIPLGEKIKEALKDNKENDDDGK
jgi:hypothetical protein